MEQLIKKSGSGSTKWVDTHKFNTFVNKLIFADVKEDVEDCRKDYENEEDFMSDTADYLGEEVELVKDSLSPFVPKVKVKKAPVKKSKK